MITVSTIQPQELPSIQNDIRHHIDPLLLPTNDLDIDFLQNCQQQQPKQQNSQHNKIYRKIKQRHIKKMAWQVHLCHRHIIQMI